MAGIQAQASAVTAHNSNVSAQTGTALILDPAPGMRLTYSCTGGFQAENLISVNCGNVNDSATGGLHTLMSGVLGEFSGLAIVQLPDEGQTGELNCVSDDPLGGEIFCD